MIIIERTKFNVNERDKRDEMYENLQRNFFLI